MAASRTEIEKWFDHGVEKGATHLVVACDTFDWDDYPVYVEAGQDARAIAADYDGRNMQKLMEVYDLKKDKASQLKQWQTFNY